MTIATREVTYNVDGLSARRSGNSADGLPWMHSLQLNGSSSFLRSRISAGPHPSGIATSKFVKGVE